MNIEYWRTEIDEVDRELLQLLNRRARLAMKVGSLKKAAGLPFCDPEREQTVLHTLQQANTGPLDRRAITKVFRRIIRESRRVEAQALEPIVSGEGGGDKLKFARHSPGSREALL
jgi:chorismate mutase / prephenate dehydratase